MKRFLLFALALLLWPTGGHAQQFLRNQNLDGSVPATCLNNFTFVDLSASTFSYCVNGTTITIGGSGGAISGSGTTGTITKFTGANAIGDSLLTDDGIGVVSVDPQWTAATVIPYADGLLKYGGLFLVKDWAIDDVATTGNVHINAFGARTVTIGSGFNPGAGSGVDIFSASVLSASAAEAGLFIGDITTTAAGGLHGHHSAITNTAGTDAGLIGVRSTVTNENIAGTAKKKYLFLGESSGVHAVDNGLIMGGAVEGVVTTTGTAVEWVSGTQFTTGATWDGAFIRINTVEYTVSSVTDATNLVLTGTAGNQSNVRYTVGGARTGIQLQNMNMTNLFRIDGPLNSDFLMYGSASGASPSLTQFLKWDRANDQLMLSAPIVNINFGPLKTASAFSVGLAAGDVVIFNAKNIYSDTAAHNANYQLIGGNSGNQVVVALNGQTTVIGGAGIPDASGNDWGADASRFDFFGLTADLSTSVTSALYNTATNCADSAGDAACAAAPAGSIVVDAADTTTVVSTTAVTADSQIFVMIDASLGTRLSVTCNTQAGSVFNPRVTARTAATSFTITVDAGPTTDPLCLSYFIAN